MSTQILVAVFLECLLKLFVNLFKAIYVPADDLTDPAPATTFAHLDATTVLSRGIAELGIYPAVDPLDSTSRILDPNVVGDEHYGIARGVQKILQVSWNFLTHLHFLLLTRSCENHVHGFPIQAYYVKKFVCSPAEFIGGKNH